MGVGPGSSKRAQVRARGAAQRCRMPDTDLRNFLHLSHERGRFSAWASFSKRPTHIPSWDFLFPVSFPVLCPNSLLSPLPHLFTPVPGPDAVPLPTITHTCTMSWCPSPPPPTLVHTCTRSCSWYSPSVSTPVSASLWCVRSLQREDSAGMGESGEKQAWAQVVTWTWHKAVAQDPGMAECRTPPCEHADQFLACLAADHAHVVGHDMQRTAAYPTSSAI